VGDGREYDATIYVWFMARLNGEVRQLNAMGMIWDNDRSLLSFLIVMASL
jgi:hypothetical protein